MTLTTYKMDWTVRYFLYMKKKWVSKSGTSLTGNIDSGSGSTTSTGIFAHSLSPGAMAYCNRKKGMWEELAKKADSIFKLSNPAYQSPL